MNYFYSIKNKVVLLFCLLSFSSFSQEICNNGIDDDADGLIDLNDVVDCVCGAGTSTLVPSLIPNPSFETIAYCPTSFSQLNGAASWVQATDATSDYFNTCGYVFPALTGTPLLPFPAGNGAAGTLFLQDWKEYLGTCLTSAMLAGTQYQIQFKVSSLSIDQLGNACPSGINNTLGPVNITIFGANNCSSLPINGTDCPSSLSPAWSPLGVISYTPSLSWSTVTITFTPSSNINTIMLGPPCVLPPSYPNGTSACIPYFIFDDLTLNSSSAFGLVDINPIGNYCTNNLVLNSVINNTVTPAATLQWYHNGIAIVGATSSTYSVPIGTTGIGTYQVQLNDGSLCALSGVFNVTNIPPSITVNSSSICPAGSTTLSANSVYSVYAWSTSASTNSIIVSPSNTTTYSVIGILGTCTAQATSTVTVFSSSLSVLGNTTVCAGQSTTLTASGSTNYEWFDSGTNSLNDYFNPVVIATPFTTTTYTVNGSSAAGSSFCTSLAMITVSVIPSPTISISPISPLICPGNTITLTANVIGSNTYTWSTNSNANSITVNPTVNTTYTIFSSAGTCTSSAVVTVNMDSAPTINVNSPIICFGQQATLLASGASTYSWSSGFTSNPLIVSPTSTTIYTLTGSNGLNCSTIKIVTVTVNHPIANYSGINSTFISINTNLQLINTSSNATNYEWELCDGIVSTNTNITLPLTDTGSCCIKLKAYYNSCIDSITNCFKVIKEEFVLIEIPNVFTPNGDNRNDVFSIKSSGLKSLHCTIFNRWGLKVYEWDGISGGWNGTIKSTPASSGTYFYIVEYTDFKDTSKQEKGYLNLFKD